MKSVFRFLCLCLLALSFAAATSLLTTSMAPAAHAQGIITGGITGTVTDQTGAVIPNASIKATNQGTGSIFQAASSGQGEFNITDVPIGVYSVTVNANGFSAQTLRDVHVVAGNQTPLKVSLSLGKEAQTIEVEGSASELVNTESAQVEDTINTEQLASAPVTGAMDNLTLMVPGVVMVHADGNSNTNGVNFSVNGVSGRSNNSEIDGQTNNDTSIGGPSFFFSNQDAIQELQVLTTDMGAEYGRNRGAIVNYITKSGTNEFHGTGFEIYTGSWLSSLTPYQKATQYGFCPPGQNAACESSSGPYAGLTIPFVPRFVQNNWGGTLGGPIWKNKIFFFGSTLYSHTYESGQTLTSSGTVFPDATGLSTLSTTFASNPAVAALQANGPYSSKLGNPTAIPGTTQDIMVTDGVNTASVETAQYERVFPEVILDAEDLFRIDWNVTPKDKVYLRYNYQNNPYTNAFYLVSAAQADGGAFPNVNGVTYETGGDWTHTLTPNVVNQLRYAFQQSNIGFYGGAIPTCTITDQNTCSSYVAMGSPFSAYGYSLAGPFPQGRTIKVNEIQDNASWTKGRHTLLFGGEFDAQHSPWGFLPNDEGFFNFSPGVAGSFNLGECGTACDNGLTGFLEGIGTLALSEGSPTIPFKENDYDLYFQDNFKINQHLTLNLGVRYEFWGQAINFLHDETVARQQGSDPFWSTSLPLSATTIPSIPSDVRNIEPRIGFAYTPSFAPKMVIHGGYSINADPEFYLIFVNMATGAPAVNSGVIPCAGPGSSTNCVPSGGLTYATVQAADDSLIPTGGDPRLNPIQTVSSNFHNPQGETYSLGFQYQLFPSAVADIHYTGNHAYGLFQAVNGNPDVLAVQSLFPSYGASTTPCTDPTANGYGRPNCNYNALEVYGNGGFSLYNALQTSLTMRNYRGFTGTIGYTWSREIDNTTDVAVGGVGGQASPFAQDPLNSDRGERGVDGNSYPNVFSLQLTYTEPWFSSQRGIVGRLLGGYMFNAFYQYNSGEPYNPIQNINSVQSPAVQADIAGTGSISPAVAATINPTEAQYTMCDLGFSNGIEGGATPCRPVLSNRAAPLNTIGINLGPGGYVDYVSGNPVSPSSEHWLWSNQYQSLAAGTPFPGVGRNILRGDTWNDIDISVAKTFKVAERVNLQIMASAFDVLNRAYYNNPDINVEDSLTGTFETQTYTAGQGSGAGDGAYPQGLGNRNIQLTGKIIF
jgi:hypothetical protein